ncbi:MAG: site-specific DNA-methyltransferase [Phycisphaeraceae bacterium]|nr:site-specific DNA-methyltransferase [Phycisphaeraceae bacterium]
MATGPAIVRQDWLDAAEHVRRSGLGIDLVYVDPPFNTGEIRASPANGRRLNRATRERFDDRFASTDGFIAWLRERLAATIPLIRPTGSILVHLDWRTSHRARVVLDELLGEDRFVNHLVWSYGLGGSSPRRFARKHDDILWYCIDPERYYFEPPRVPATSARMRGMMKKATDVLDIPSINNMAKERTGYPTQKPLALLEMLVGACCPPGGVVWDPCCGSGTTLVAAARTGRVGIGSDASEAAVRLARRRLAGGGGAGPGGLELHRMLKWLGRLYAKRLVNVNVNILLSNTLAVGLTAVAVHFSRFIGIRDDQKWLITAFVFVVDLAIDVVVYYALHWTANHWPKRLWHTPAEVLNEAPKPSFFWDATVVQAQRMALSPVFYGVAMALLSGLLHDGVDRVSATVISYGIAIGISRTLHTLWMISSDRAMAKRLREAGLGKTDASIRPPAASVPAAESRTNGAARAEKKSA